MQGVSEYLFYSYITAIGFCMAGLTTSLAQMVTGQRLRFEVESVSFFAGIIAVLTRVLAGPAIVMRNAIKAAFLGRPAYWLAISTMISVVWSFFSGIVILELAVRLVWS